MAIINAPEKTILNEALFSNNNKIKQIIENHNKYIKLYSPGFYTISMIEELQNNETDSTLFYNNPKNIAILKACFEYQQALLDIEEAQKLSLFKDSYLKTMWHNKNFGRDSMLTALLGASSIYMLVILGPVGIAFLALTMMMAAVIAYQTYKEQNQAEDRYQALIDNLNLTAADASAKPPVGPRDYSFFNDKKNDVEDSINNLDPESNVATMK